MNIFRRSNDVNLFTDKQHCNTIWQNDIPTTRQDDISQQLIQTEFTLRYLRTNTDESMGNNKFVTVNKNRHTAGNEQFH